MKIVVMGQGYVGLPLAMAASQAGHDVIGYDPNAERTAQLATGRSYVEDVSDAELSMMLKLDRYTPTSDDAYLLHFEVAVIAVPTPLKDRLPDLAYIRDAAITVGARLERGATVVLESTTHPGTTRDVLIPILERVSGLTAGEDFHVGFSPERIDPGNPQYSFRNTTKIISGLTPRCTAKVGHFYSGIVESFVIAKSLESAELAKILENTYRHVNIALVNELSRFAHTLGIDIWDAIGCASTKPFGFHAFYPGPGVGGHCLPIDPVYLSHHVKTVLGESFRFVELAQDINEQQPAYVVRRLQDALNDRFGKPLKGSRILALGAAYKPGTGDYRESPAIAVIEGLETKGCAVDVMDPRVTDMGCGMHAPIPYADYDAVVLLTPHDEFDLAQIADNATYVLDTRGVMPTRDNTERL